MPASSETRNPLHTLLLILACCAASRAQSWSNPLSVPTDPVTAEQLARASRAYEGGNHETAFESWQGLLDRTSDRVVLTRRTASNAADNGEVEPGDVFRGVRSHVMRLLRALPDDGLQRYRDLMEPRASRLLRRAMRQRDARLLWDCARRFLLTPSGRRAALAHIDLLLEDGHAERARTAAQRLRAQDVGVADDDPWTGRVLAREAVALWSAGRDRALERLAGVARRDHSATSVSVAGDATPLPAFIDRMRLRPVRPRVGTPGLPPLEKGTSWSRSIRVNENEYGRRYGYGSFDSLGDTTMLPVVPLVDGGVVYFCDGMRLKAHRLTTGAPVWSPVQSSQSDFLGSPHAELRYHVVLDGDLVFAYLQGEPLYERPWRYTMWEVPSHKLVAVDRRTGRVVWSHLEFEGRTAEETRFIERLSIAQPPYVVGDTLYAAGTAFEGMFRHWICAFERATGRIRWRTFVGAGQTRLGRGGVPLKACIPGHVLEHGGIVYFSTNMGVACAVDAATGAIIWQSAYERERDAVSYRSRRRWRRSFYGAGRPPSWMPARPVAVSGRILLPCSDAPHLIAADEASGRLDVIRPSTLSARHRQRDLLGLRDGLVVIGGPEVFALDARTLRPVWRHRATVPVEFESFGRPELTGSSIVFTAANEEQCELLTLDVTNGQLTARRPLGETEILGNVALGGGCVVLGTADAVTARFP